ncbi:hypothetical protein F5Y18DRAFT_67194 [Xylariaceae sp. FL1019]|nr:hypothetical protein F5Y18DRAFT_67194 [Xylariaceae sp. FL1019]
MRKKRSPYTHILRFQNKMIEQGESSRHVMDRHNTTCEQNAQLRQYEYKASESSTDTRISGLSDYSEIKTALDSIVFPSKLDKGKAPAANGPQGQSLYQDEPGIEPAASGFQPRSQISSRFSVTTHRLSMNEEFALWLAADAAGMCDLPELHEDEQRTLANFEMSDPWMEGILRRASWSIDSAEFGTEHDAASRYLERSETKQYADEAFAQTDGGYGCPNEELDQEQPKTNLALEECAYCTQMHPQAERGGPSKSCARYRSETTSLYTATAGPSQQPTEMPRPETRRFGGHSPQEVSATAAWTQVEMSVRPISPSFRVLGVQQGPSRYAAQSQNVPSLPAQTQSTTAHPPGYHTLFPDSFRITVPTVRECVRRQQARIREHMPKCLRLPSRSPHER